ncbi:MAG: TonB C-terminal domain-containing protein [Deltaproteobacteria bacterium]|nr:TonB C-terminal domain-containing protein [Deltaproteobacteria bacterium]
MLPAAVQSTYGVRTPDEHKREAEAYLRAGRARVLRHWTGPTSVSATVEMEFQVAANGCVTYARVLSSTSDAAARSTLRAVTSATPLAPPPDRVVGEVLFATFSARVR